MVGTWKPLANQPPVTIDTMLLLTDGSVMCHEYEASSSITPNWYKLVPNAFTDYASGTWHKLTPMPSNAPLGQNGPVDAPLYFASSVLRDGRVFVAGGEYNVSGGTGVDLVAASIYDPVADSWASIATPPGWTVIGDAPTCVLPDGRVLMGNINTTQTAILDPVTRTWSPGGTKNDASSEEGWTLLPDGTIICAEVTNHPQAEKYLIASNQWIPAGATPPGYDLVRKNSASIEIGPAILMPDGRVFWAGATGHTALYLPPLLPAQPGTWVPGPDFPNFGGNPQAAFDAPACLLPNGSVLCAVGPITTAWAGPPTHFYEYDGALLNAVPTPASAAGEPTYNARLLLLPSGQVLYSNCTSTIELYTPSGGPQPAWQPHITEVPHHLHPGESYRLHGRQLNGLSQAVAYGDDAQMATNYPLVRLQGPPSFGNVFCRTFDHSTMAVATGSAIHHTHFHVPANLPHGRYELVVIANGIPSPAVEVHVGHKEEAPAEPKHDDQDRHDDRRDRDQDRHREPEEEGGYLTVNLKLPLGTGRR